MAPDPETENISLLPSPDWPTDIHTFEDLADFLTATGTISIGNSLYNVDFHPPQWGSYAMDESAYTQDDPRTPFVFMMFGKVSRPATFSLEGGRELPSVLRDLYANQIKVLSAPIIEDDNGQTFDQPRIVPCTDSDRRTGNGGKHIEVHTDHVGHSACTVHLSQDGKPARVVSSWTRKFPVDVGEWVLIEATLHRRTDMAQTNPRQYEVLARHVRPLTELRRADEPGANTAGSSRRNAVEATDSNDAEGAGTRFSTPKRVKTRPATPPAPDRRMTRSQKRAQEDPPSPSPTKRRSKRKIPDNEIFTQMSGDEHPVIGNTSSVEERWRWRLYTPAWPQDLGSPHALEQYILNKGTAALATALFNVDFKSPPSQYVYNPMSLVDHTAYQHGSPSKPFKFMLFGRVFQKAIRVGAHRTFFLYAGNDLSPELERLYAKQIEVLSEPVLEDDLWTPNLRALPCTDSMRATGKGGRDGKSRRVVSNWAEELPIAIGQWVLIEATYHRREEISIPRAYEVLAHHIRALDFGTALHTVSTPRGPSSSLAGGGGSVKSPPESLPVPRTPKKTRSPKKAQDTSSLPSRDFGVETRSKRKVHTISTESPAESLSTRHAMDNVQADILAPIRGPPPPGTPIDNVPDELLDEILAEVIGQPTNFSAYTLARRFTKEAFLTFTLRMAHTAPTFDLLLDAVPYSVAVVRAYKFLPVVSKPMALYGEMVGSLVEGSFSKVGRISVTASNCEDWAHMMSVLTRFDAPNLYRVDARRQGPKTRPGWVLQPTPAWQGIRSLTLDGINPMWFGSSILSGLSELALGRMWGGFRINASQLLGMLRAAPQLTVLKMQDVDCIPSVMADEVTMQRLTHFCFIYSMDRCVDVLQYFHTPALRHLRVDAHRKAQLAVLLPVANGILGRAQDLQLFSDQHAAEAVSSCVLAARSAVTLDLSKLGARATSSLSQALVRDGNAMPRICRLTISGNIPESYALETVGALQRHGSFVLVVVGDEGTFTEWRAQAGDVHLRQLRGWRNDMDIFWDQYPIRRVPIEKVA
ncbi:hypothetical protein DFH06DRAFT_1134828 [Mycena polygramma]|nr:hypothetical protein DFH06DRAFT_1134828 [Mycena polygramma]